MSDLSTPSLDFKQLLSQQKGVSICFISPDFKVLQVFTDNFFQWEKKEIEKKNYLDFIHALDHEKLKDSFSNMVENESFKTTSYRLMLPSNKYLEVESCGTPLYENNQLVGFSLFSKDSLLFDPNEADHERFEYLIENASDIIYKCDAEGFFTYFNSVSKPFLGEGAEYTKTHFTEVIRKDHVQRVSKFYKNQFEKRIKNTYNEFPIITTSGEEIWIGQNVQIITKDEWVLGFHAFGRNITDRKKAEDQLRKAKKKAELAAKGKEQFLSSMSHEIRTPLNNVIGLTNLLLEEDSLGENQNEHLKAIEHSANNLLNIINDILDLSTIGSKKIIIDSKEFNLKVLFSNLETSFNPQLQENVTLSFEILPHTPENFSGDIHKLNQILTNLISNAIKFTSKGSIKVTAKLSTSHNEDNTTIDFEVKDTGVGIIKENLEIIFDSYNRASQETSKKYGGTGLGLAITKSLVDLLKGKIRVESKVNKGTTFQFSIPLKVSNRDAYEQKTGADMIPFENTTALVVEDNNMNQMVISKYLEKWNIEYDMANNGLEAIEKTKVRKYDIILMDLEMPNMDGYETTKAIRKNTENVNASIPIVAISASAFEKVRKDALASGMDDYVSKPFKPEILYHKIDSQLKNSVIDHSTKLYDLTYLNGAASGDQEFINKMITTFLTYTPDYIIQLENSLKDQNYNELKRLAHKFKATITIVGVQSVQNLIADLEDCIEKKEEMDKIPEIVRGIINLSTKTADQLRQDFNV